MRQQDGLAIGVGGIGGILAIKQIKDRQAAASMVATAEHEYQTAMVNSRNLLNQVGDSMGLLDQGGPGMSRSLDFQIASEAAALHPSRGDQLLKQMNRSASNIDMYSGVRGGASRKALIGVALIGAAAFLAFGPVELPHVKMPKMPKGNPNNGPGGHPTRGNPGGTPGMDGTTPGGPPSFPGAPQY